MKDLRTRGVSAHSPPVEIVSSSQPESPSPVRSTLLVILRKSFYRKIFVEGEVIQNIFIDEEGQILDCLFLAVASHPSEGLKLAIARLC